MKKNMKNGQSKKKNPSHLFLSNKTVMLLSLVLVIATSFILFISRQKQQIVQYAASDAITVLSASDFQSTGASLLKTTSDLALTQNADYVLAVGDISDQGTLATYQSSYTPTWGRLMSTTYPAPGNHDKNPGSLTQYLQYFSSRYPNSSTPYYSVNWGAWHIVSLDSNNPSAAQIDWLKQDLAANPNKPILAFWHFPRWSTDDTHGDDVAMKVFWDPLYAAHADVIVNGHVHVYQRYAQMDGAGTLKADGIREFTDGTAGNNPRTYTKTDPHLEYRLGGASGFMKFTLTPTNYSWAYIKSDGSIIDAGSAPVHNSRSQTTITQNPVTVTLAPTNVNPTWNCVNQGNSVCAPSVTPTGPTISISPSRGATSPAPSASMFGGVSPTIDPCIGTTSIAGRHHARKSGGQQNGGSQDFIAFLMQLIQWLLNLLGQNGNITPPVTATPSTNPTNGPSINPTVNPCVTGTQIN